MQGSNNNTINIYLLNVVIIINDNNKIKIGNVKAIGVITIN